MGDAASDPAGHQKGWGFLCCTPGSPTAPPHMRHHLCARVYMPPVFIHLLDHKTQLILNTETAERPGHVPSLLEPLQGFPKVTQASCPKSLGFLAQLHSDVPRKKTLNLAATLPGPGAQCPPHVSVSM